MDGDFNFSVVFWVGLVLGLSIPKYAHQSSALSVKFFLASIGIRNALTILLHTLGWTLGTVCQILNLFITLLDINSEASVRHYLDFTPILMVLYFASMKGCLVAYKELTLEPFQQTTYVYILRGIKMMGLVWYFTNLLTIVATGVKDRWPQRIGLLITSWFVWHMISKQFL